jgi:CRP/FNR family cyclic AMP-dependent transcriptional regulator
VAPRTARSTPSQKINRATAPPPAFGAGPCFEIRDRAAWERLLTLGPALDVPPRASLVRQGAPCDTICVLISGTVRISVTSSRGRSVAVALESAPWIGPLTSLVPLGDAPASVTTMTRAQLCSIPVSALRSAIARDHALNELVLGFAAHQARVQMESRAECLTETVEARLLSTLIDVVRHRNLQGRKGPVAIEVIATQAELAEALGCRHEHLNRVLRQLSAQDLAHWRHGTIVVPSPARLINARDGLIFIN